MLTLIASLAVLTVPQGLDQKITWQARSAPASRFIRDLADQTGLPLAAGSSVADDVLVASVRDVPVREFLDQIAVALDAEWRDEAGKRVLVRSAATTRAQEERELEYRSAHIQRELQKLQASMSEKVWDQAAAEHLATRVAALERESGDRMNYRHGMALSAETPVGRLIVRLAAELSPVELAKLQSERVVYSAAPTKMQRPLPPTAQRAIELFVQEHALWTAAASKLAPEPEEPHWLSQALIRKPVERQPAKVLLVVEQRGLMSMGGFQFSVIVADDAGNIMFRTNRSVGDPWENMEELLAASSSGTPVAFGPLSRSYLDLLRRLGQEEDPQEPGDPELLQFLRRPDVNEPLDLVLSDAVQAIAADRSKNIVVHLHDLMMPLVAWSAMGPATSEKLYGVMARAGGIEWVEAKDWIVGRQKRPALYRAQRADRTSLAKVFQLLANKEHLSLTDQAAVVSLLPDEELSLMLWVLMIAFPQAQEVAASSHDHWALRLYASLSEAQRRTLRQEEELSVADLTAEQRQIVSRAAFRGVGLTFRHNQGGSLSLLTEPTEGMPNGLPPSATISGVASVVEAFFGFSTPGATGRTEAFTPEGLAWHRFAASRPDLFPWVVHQPAANYFRPGAREEFFVTVHLTELLELDAQLSANQYNGRQEAVPYDRLPEAFRRAVEEHTARLVESYKHGHERLGGNRPPPPRP
jgi:hypothetical protein